MKIAFITTDFIIDPLAIGYLSAYLKRAGFEVDLFKTTGHWITEVIKYNPQMLCYSVNSATFRQYIDINNTLRKWVHAFSLFGGPHCTFFPDWAENETNVDAICRGEGFDAIVDVANAVANFPSAKAILKDTYNLNSNPLRQLQDKSTLLHPDRKLMYKYEKNYKNLIKNVICSFGCMMNCSYCYASKWRDFYNLRGAELRPVSDVIDEIKELTNYPLGLIYFQDDIFPLYKQVWIDEFIDLYSEIKVPFHIQSRIEMIKKDVIDRLVKVGLHGVTYAVESADEQFRKEVLNRRVDNETIVLKNQILQEAGLHVRVENMLGAPGETYNQAKETLKFNAKLKPDIGWASIFQPYPGTKLGDQYFDNKEILPENFFSHQNHGEGRIANLQKFFALGTQFPKLIPLINQLTKLPANSLFSAVYRTTKKYLYDNRLYQLK